jgi:hypothetical protein
MTEEKLLESIVNTCTVPSELHPGSQNIKVTITQKNTLVGISTRVLCPYLGPNGRCDYKVKYCSAGESQFCGYR